MFKADLMPTYYPKQQTLKSFVVQILHDSYLGATAALDLGVARLSALVLM